MNSFETNPKSLKLLLTQIHNGELALPDFQRDFVWDPSAIEELIESIMRNYPAGSLLFLKHGGEGFQVREFQGAPALKSTLGTSYLVLDGQQRLTSLYQAFFGKGEHRFFLGIGELIEGDDIEAAVWHESERRCQKMGLNKIEVQSEKLICPLEVVMGDGFDAWVDAVLDLRAEKDEARKELRGNLRQVHREWIQPILEYQFPVITLGADTSLDAVCKMFETLNRRGVKLTVFELLMARSFAEKVSLRTLWDKTVEEHSILSDFGIDPYYVLQVISLLNGHSIKRKEILDMDPAAVSKDWQVATEALADSLSFLRRNAGVLSVNLLPYVTMIVPMAAAWAKTAGTKGPKEATRSKKLKQWFWASVFAQMYEKGPTSRAVSDYKELVSWIKDDGKEPFALRALYFTPDMFFDITPKQRALYRGSLALLVSRGALDFHKSEPLTYEYMEKFKVDDHHIFPQNYLKKSGESSSRINCVLNRTLIDKKTNIRISDKAPNVYSKEISDEIGGERLKHLYDSHRIHLEHLVSNSFDAFLKDRSKALMATLRDAYGQEIPSIPSAFSEDQDQIEDEDDRLNPRDRVDPSVVNAKPAELLDGLSSETAELFDAFSKALLAERPDVWWKSNTNKVVFWAPEKVFASVRLSRTGLHFVVFTDGRELSGAEPIVQKDRGGELWGRIKLKSAKDLQVCMRSIIESHSRLQAAHSQGRATAWWAMTRKAA